MLALMQGVSSQVAPQSQELQGTILSSVIDLVLIIIHYSEKRLGKKVKQGRKGDPWHYAGLVYGWHSLIVFISSDLHQLYVSFLIFKSQIGYVTERHPLFGLKSRRAHTQEAGNNNVISHLTLKRFFCRKSSLRVFTYCPYSQRFCKNQASFQLRIGN